MDQIRIIGVIRSYSIRAESYSERESLNIKETYNYCSARIYTLHDLEFVISKGQLTNEKFEEKISISLFFFFFFKDNAEEAYQNVFLDNEI